MNFGKALDILLENTENGIPAEIRRVSWDDPDVHIRLQIPDINSFMTAPYLYVESNAKAGLQKTRRVPWIPNMVEMCVADDWEVVI